MKLKNLFVTLSALIFIISVGRVQAQIDLWHFDEGSGTTTTDSTGSNPGTLYGSPLWVSGISISALHFNGSGQYVEVSANSILSNLNGGGQVQNFTIEAWLKWDGGGVAGSQSVYGEGDAVGSPGVELFLNSGVPSFFVNNVSTGGKTVSGTSSLPAGQWHHLAGVLQSGVGGILYVDGQVVATNASIGTLWPPYGGQSDIGRGIFTANADYFDGTIDEVQLFNTARSASQVLADYQQYTVQLNIASAGNQSVLFWPASATNYVLQSTTNLASPKWVTVSNGTPIIGVTLTNNLPVAFFRLQQQ